MNRVLIRGGRILDPAQDKDEEADLLIEDGQIAAVGPGLSAADAEVVEAGKAARCRSHHRRREASHAEVVEGGTTVAR